MRKINLLTLLVSSSLLFSCATGPTKEELAEQKRLAEVAQKKAQENFLRGKIRQAIVTKNIGDLKTLHTNAKKNISKRRYSKALGLIMKGLQITRNNYAIEGNLEKLTTVSKTHEDFLAGKAFNFTENQEIRNQELALRILVARMAKTGGIRTKIPEEAKKYGVRGNTKVKMKKYSDAAREFDNALFLAPWWGKAYYNQGYVYEGLGEYDKAIDSFKLFMMLSKNKAEVDKIKNHMYELEVKLEEQQKWKKFEGRWLRLGWVYHLKYNQKLKQFRIVREDNLTEMLVNLGEVDTMNGILNVKGIKVQHDCMLPDYSSPLTSIVFDSVNNIISSTYTYNNYWVKGSWGVCQEVFLKNTQQKSFNLTKVPTK